MRDGTKKGSRGGCPPAVGRLLLENHNQLAQAGRCGMSQLDIPEPVVNVRLQRVDYEPGSSERMNLESLGVTGVRIRPVDLIHDVTSFRNK